ncbi:MAG: carbohydrate kinase family protein [Patescibacteria group bacterium]
MKQLDFVAIGDIVTDAFIRLKEAEVQPSIDHTKQELCMEFAAKIPYESVTIIPAVGNSANAAIAAARLGLSSALVANQGDDTYAKENLVVLKNEHVLRDFIKNHPGANSNYHYVLWYGAERTILVKHENYSYHLPDIGSPKWLYLTSLGANTLTFHLEIEEYLKKHPEVKLAFQPGTFQIAAGIEKMRYFYSRAEVLVMNVEEAEKVTGLPGDAKIRELTTALHKLGSKIILITDGPKGAYLSTGRNAWFMPAYPDPKPPYERTGAGDAFASTFVSALALGKTPEEALRWAPINSMSVVQHVGAREGLLSLSVLKKYLQKAPPDYEPTPLG